MTLTGGAARDRPTAVREFFDSWKEAWNDHDGDAVAALCAKDLVYDEPALGGTVHGRDAIRDYVRAMDTAFPDHEFVAEGLYAEVTRSAVLVAWRFVGTHAPTGNRVEFHGDDRLEFGDDGLVSAYRCLYDHDLVRRQLGKRPAP